MERIAFLLVASAIAVGVAAFKFPASEHTGRKGPDLCNPNSRRIPRLEIDLRSPRGGQSQRCSRDFRQRPSDQGLSGTKASFRRWHGHCPAGLELRSLGKQRTRCRCTSLVAGAATNVRFMIKDSKKYAATGGSPTQLAPAKPGNEAVVHCE